MKKRFRKKGFVLLPVVLATFIIGMLGVGLASMYQSTFSTMSAGKAASQAKDFANVKVTGYDDSSSVVHDWQDLSTVVGPDGASWQSKVEDTGRTQVSPTGDKVKVMKVSVRKNGELVSRYSQEVPLVDGKDVSSKAEIDSMMKVVDGQIQTLTNHVDTEVDRLDGDVAKVNSSLDALSKLVNNYHDQLVSDINAERTARESADTNLNNAVNKEVSDRKNAIAQSEAKLNQRIDDIQADIKKLHDSVNTNTANIKTNASNINTNKDNISKNASGIKTNADAIADINSRLATLRTDFDALSTKNTGVTNRVKAIEDRLNGNEFIKNATTGNSIKIGWDASSKALYGMVDGNKVPLSTQNGDGGNIIQEKETALEFYIHITEDASTGESLEYYTNGVVDATLYEFTHVYLNGPYGKIQLVTFNPDTILDSTTTNLEDAFGPDISQDSCMDQSKRYVHNHIDEFKAKIAKDIPEYYKATKTVVRAGVTDNK